MSGLSSLRLLLLAVALAVGGCGGVEGGGPARETVTVSLGERTRVAVVARPSVGRAVRAGMRAAIDQLGVVGSTFLSPRQADDRGTVVRALRTHPDLILVAGGELLAEVEALRAARPRLRLVVIEPDGEELPAAALHVFLADEVGLYLAGYLAGLLADGGAVAVGGKVSSKTAPELSSAGHGALAAGAGRVVEIGPERPCGAPAGTPEAAVLVSLAKSCAQPAPLGARAAVLRLQDGRWSAVAWAVVRLDIATFKAIEAARQQTSFASRTLTLGLADHVVELAPVGTAVPASVWERLERRRRAVVNGSVQPVPPAG